MHEHDGTWFNYQTGEYEAYCSPTTDEEALAHMPQHRAVAGLYRVRRAQGDDILTAMVATLKACVGETGEKEDG